MNPLLLTESVSITNYNVESDQPRYDLEFRYMKKYNLLSMKLNYGGIPSAVSIYNSKLITTTFALDDIKSLKTSCAVHLFNHNKSIDQLIGDLFEKYKVNITARSRVSMYGTIRLLNVNMQVDEF